MANNFSVEDALSSRKKRKEEERSLSVDKALADRKQRITSSIDSISSDINSRLNDSVRKYTDYENNYSSGNNSTMSDVLNNQRVQNVANQKAMQKVNAYRNYLDESAVNEALKRLGAIDSGYQYKVDNFFDTDASKEKIDRLTGIKNDYERQSSRVSYDQAYGAAMRAGMGKDKAKEYAQSKVSNYLEGTGYSSIEDVQKDLTAETKRYNTESRKQEFNNLVYNAKNSADFDQMSEAGKNASGLTEFRNDSAKMAAYESALSNTQYGSIFGEDKRVKATKYMTDDEMKVYNYYLGIGDLESANRYLELSEETLNYRKAEEEFKEVEGKALTEIFNVGAKVGLNQFATGITNVFNTEDQYINQNSTQMLSGMVREDLPMVGRVAYDTVTTTANMMPSILASSLISMIPGVGAVGGGIVAKTAGAGLMGASASGNAYQEMLNQGYSKEQSRTYATITGLSEAMLQEAIGGVSALGGNVTGAPIKKFAEGLNNAAARFAVEVGGNMASEGLEEFLQDVLDPFFKAAVTGEDREPVDWSQAIYSGLLGALSAGMFEVPGQISRVNDIKSTYGQNQEELVLEGLESAEGTRSRKVAEEYAKKLDGGKDLSGIELKNLVEANEEVITDELSAEYDEIESDIQTALSDYGISEKAAKPILDEAKGYKLGAKAYLNGLNLAYEYGRTNQQSKLGDIVMTDSTKNLLFTVGKENVENANKSRKVLNDRYPNVRLENNVNLNELEPDVRKRAEASIAVANVLSKVSPIEFTAIQSYKKGNRTFAIVNGEEIETSANGWFSVGTNKIYFAVNAGDNYEGMGVYTCFHEGGHYLRENNPEGFAKIGSLVEEIINKMAEKNPSKYNSFEQDLAVKLSQYEKFRAKGSEDYSMSDEKLKDIAYEDVVCDAISVIGADKETFVEFANRLKEEDKGLWKKIKDFISEWIENLSEKLDAYFNGGKMIDANQNSARAIQNALKEDIDRLRNLYVDAFIGANENYNSRNAEVSAELAENGIIVNDKTNSASLESARFLLDDKQKEKVVNNLTERFGVTEEEATSWLTAETSLASLILNPKYSAILDYEADPDEEAIKQNSDYPQGTVDFSTICAKRREFTNVMNSVMRNFPNHVFAATDLAKIRTIMQKEGMTIPCGICYVEDRRQLDTIVAQDFIDSLKLYREGSETRPNGQPFNTNQLKAFKLIDGDSYVPSVYELVTLEGKNALKAKDPNMARAWNDFNNARGMQAVRQLTNEAEYKRQILKLSKSAVKSKNDRGGLRIYSFSDAEMFHLIDIIQVITDSSAVGLSIQGYTKVNEYAKAVKDTGEKLNRSLIPKGDLGYHMEGDKVVLDYDTVEGIDINSKDFFDNKDNPNIGNITIGVSDVQIRAAMVSDFVDQIIPFHTGQSKDVLGEKGIASWSNYKDSQTEKDIATGRTSKHQINIYTEVIQALEKDGVEVNKRSFVEKFLEVCKENGLTPRFSQFLKKDADGNYIYTEGYHKLLVDFKTFAQTEVGEYLPQMPVKPIFDDAYITGLLENYVDEQKTKDAKIAKQMPNVVKRITEEIIKPEQNVETFTDKKSGEEVKYSIRTEEPPKKTVKGYKVFFVKDGKLYPPMVANPNGADTPVGVWLNADIGVQAPDSKTGRKQVKAGGKGTQGGSGSLAFRPGWHLGETPLATQFDRTNPETGVRELFPENFVWAECDVAADYDYQEEAMSYGYNANGKFQHSLAGLPKLPVDGYYKYRTNPNPETVPWLITGAMKVNRLLSDAEVNAILAEKGLPPKQRQGGQKTLADLGLGQYESKNLYSIRKTVDGETFVEIDSNMKNLPDNADFKNEIANVIKNQYKNVITANGQTFKVNIVSNKEFRESVWAKGLRKKDSSAYYDKLRTFANLDELLESAKDWINEAPKHPRKDKIVSFGTANVLYRVNGNGYEAKIVVGVDMNANSLIYDIVDIKRKKINAISGNGANAPLSAKASINSKVSQNAKTVNKNSERDSSGKNLSKEQQMFFAESKVRDAEGNLRVVYHGSPENFTVFKPNEWTKESSGVTQIKGYFSTSEEYADIYGSTKPYYLNIKNPLYLHEDTVKGFLKQLKKAGVKGAKIDSGATEDTVLGGNYDGEMYYLPYELIDSRSMYWRGDGNITQKIKEAGYDGIYWNEGTEDGDIAYMPFDENQIKLTSNLKPSNNPDTRFSDRDLDIQHSEDVTDITTGYERVPDSLMGFSKDSTKNKSFEDSKYPYTLNVWVSHDNGYTFAKDSIKGMNRPHAIERAKRNWGSDAIIKDRDSEVDYRYSERDLSQDPRMLLSNALATTAQNDIERKYIEDYQSKIDVINEEQKKLTEIRAELKELSFATGKRDTERIKELSAEATKINNRINIYDKQLLKLESTKALKDVVEREKVKARKLAEQHSREAFQRYRERRSDIDIRHKIKGIAEDLTKMLKNPTERRFVPINFVQGVIDVVNSLDPTGRTYYKSGTSDVDVARTNEMYDPESKAAEKFRTAKEALINLKFQYDSLKNVDNYDFSSEFNEEFSSHISELIEAVGDTPIREMNADQLSDVYDILSDIHFMIKYATKQIGKEDAISNYQMGQKIIEEMEEVRKKKLTTGKVGDIFREWTLNPMRAVREMTGFREDSALYSLFEDLDEGLRKADSFRMETAKKFDALRDTKETKKVFDDAVQDASVEVIDTKNNKVKISKMQAMQAILTYEREIMNPNRRHLQSPVRFTDVALDVKGKYSEAFDNGHDVYVDEAFIKRVNDVLTDWDKQYLAAARQFFNVDSKQAVNEVSMKTKHRLVATEKAYIPYYVNQDYIARESENVKFDATIEGMGMLKSVKNNAPQQLVIRGLNTVIQDHTDKVAKVYGLTIPVRNWNKAFNMKQTQKDGGDTVKVAIRNAWHDGGLNLLDQAVADLQSSRKRDKAALFSGAKSAFVTSTLAGNLSVWLKQAASYPTAGAVLSTSSLTKAFKYFGKSMTDTYAEIDAHTPEHWKRRIGLSTQELGDMNQSKGWQNRLNDKLGVASPMNWIQAMDVKTTAVLWEASKYEAIKNGMKAGTEEYWSEVTRLYNKVIEDTQPMYDPLHRAEITKNQVYSTFIMFQTQPLQNSGILREGAMKYKDYKKVYGSNSVEAKEALVEFKKAVGSQMASHLTFTLFTLIGSMILHKMNRYRDDDDEVTAASLITEFTKQFGENFIGAILPIVGSYGISIAEKFVDGNRYDVISDPTVDKINTTIDNFAKLKKPSLGAFTNMATDIASYFGVPATNIINIVNGARLHIEDISNGDFGSFEAGVDRSNKQDAHIMFNSYLAGDTAKMNKFKEDFIQEYLDKGKTEKEAKSQLKSTITSNYKQTFLEAYKKNDTETMANIRRFMNALNIYDDVVKTTQDWISKSKE